MPTTLSTAQLTRYQNRIDTGGLPEAIKVHNELYGQGYHYAGWGKGVAMGSSVRGVSALDFLSGTALLGGGLSIRKSLTFSSNQQSLVATGGNGTLCGTTGVDHDIAANGECWRLAA